MQVLSYCLGGVGGFGSAVCLSVYVGEGCDGVGGGGKHGERGRGLRLPPPFVHLTGVLRAWQTRHFLALQHVQTRHQMRQRLALQPLVRQTGVVRACFHEMKSPLGGGIWGKDL